MKATLPSFSFKRPQIMGIINITPDSFSGDGLLSAKSVLGAAIDQAAAMLEDGADWLDIGGESSRPGAALVSEQEEHDRVVPVVAAIHARWPQIPISVDTTKVSVGAAAIEAGAVVLNDISGDAMDPGMFTLAARTGAGLVLMHNAANPGEVSRDARLGGVYDAQGAADIVGVVCQSLAALAEKAQKAGVDRGRLITDPGIGFGKTLQDNLVLVRDLDRLVALGMPVLLGPSRKNFIGRILDAPPDDRLEGTAASVVVGVMKGASLLRVHDVRAMARTVRMASAILRGGHGRDI